MVGIVSGLTSALSAIGANSKFFRSTANNVANIETTGFRAEQARFESQAATGTRFNGLVDGGTAAFLQSTGGPGDLSAGGNAFLPTRDPATPDRLDLVKSASFKADANGVLTDANGRQLLGFPTDANGAVTSPGQGVEDLRPVQLPSGTASEPTTSADLAATLPANANVGDSFPATLTVIDSLGREQLLNADFTKTGVNAFDVSFNIDATQGVVSAPAGSVALGFDSTGRLASINGAGTAGSAASIGLNLDFSTSGGGNQVIAFGLGQFGDGEISQIAAPFSVNAANADGTTPGGVTGFEIDNDGIVTVTGDNGSSRAIFQVPTGTVPARTELASAGGGFTTTATSGDVLLSTSGQGGFTGINGGLSRSDVDLAREISNLAIGSSAYKAAINVARTGDELLDAIIDIKR
jgi:flagellar hook protein FlgE